MKRVFSGVQPSGRIHLGNYIGALQRFKQFQEENEAFYCVVNLHAMTVPHDPQELREKTLELAALYLAIGLDPKKSVLFVQSDVPAHAELAWMLQCVTYMGEANRMTQFKEKSEGKDSVSVGLFTYPVLMAADILLYQTDYVPVGEDQKQHLELTRDLANRFNQRFGETFKVPEPKIEKVGARIMALDNPTKKMSKSAKTEWNNIAVLDPPSVIQKKLMRAVTDSENEIRYDPERKPGVSNLLTIYSLLAGKPIKELERMYSGEGYGRLKKDLVDVVVGEFEPIQKRYEDIRNSGEVEAILAEGAERAKEIAHQTLQDVKEKMGLS
jgi:tryptophanyl-tRNA synthetase